MDAIHINFTEKDNNIRNYYMYNCGYYSDTIFLERYNHEQDSNYISWQIINQEINTSYHPAILHEGDKNNKLFTNELFNDKNIKINMVYNSPNDFDEEINYTVLGQVYSLSKEFFMYLKSYKTYNDAIKNKFSYSNPKLYSNVTNGLGIFGALNFSKVDSLYIKK